MSQIEEGGGMENDFESTPLSLENIETKGEGLRLLFALEQELDKLHAFLLDTFESITTPSRELPKRDWENLISALMADIVRHKAYMREVRLKMETLPE